MGASVEKNHLNADVVKYGEVARVYSLPDTFICYAATAALVIHHTEQDLDRFTSVIPVILSMRRPLTRLVRILLKVKVILEGPTVGSLSF